MIKQCYMSCLLFDCQGSLGIYKGSIGQPFVMLMEKNDSRRSAFFSVTVTTFTLLTAVHVYPLRGYTWHFFLNFLLLLHLHYFFKYFFRFCIVTDQIGLIFKALFESGKLLIAFFGAVF